MAMLMFNASEIDTTSTHDPIPAGTYEAVVIESKLQPTKNSTGTGLNLTFEVISGEFSGRRVFAWINFQHKNPEAQRIGQQELARLCKAVGIANLTDTLQLHNLPLMLTVGFDKQDATRNAVKNYAPKAGGQAAVQTATAAVASTAQGAVAAAPTGTAPWAR